MSLKSNLISTTYSTGSSDDKFDQGVGGPTGGAALGGGSGVGDKGAKRKCYCWITNTVNLRITAVKTLSERSSGLQVSLQNLKEVHCIHKSHHTADPFKVSVYGDGWGREVVISLVEWTFCKKCTSTDYEPDDTPGSPLTRKKCPSKKKLCDLNYDSGVGGVSLLRSGGGQYIWEDISQIWRQSHKDDIGDRWSDNGAQMVEHVEELMRRITGWNLFGGCGMAWGDDVYQKNECYNDKFKKIMEAFCVGDPPGGDPK